MNLWAKTLRQLTILSVALFFFSCEDESSLLGFKNPKQKFNVRYVDIPLGADLSQVMTIDSLITDLRPFVNQSGQTQFVDGILVGQYQDPVFGQITAQPYLGLYPVSDNALNSTAVFDSITIQLRLNFYAYGFTDEKTYQLPVHEITGDTLSLFGGRRYYATSTPPTYNPSDMGTAAITVRYDSLIKASSEQANRQDTLLVRGRLNDEFGLRVFDAIKGGFKSTAERNAFRDKIRGLTLAPSTEEPGVLGMNVVSTYAQPSRVIVHYHTLTEGGDVDDTLSTALGFEYATFTKIEADRTGTELAAFAPYEPFNPLSGQRYIQGGAGVVTKLDLAPFYAFADTVENIVVNSAELVIEDVTAPSGLTPHNSLVLRLMNGSSNQFLNTRVAADREAVAGYYVAATSPEPYLVAATEGSAPITISYNRDASRFSGSLTLFAQSLFANKNDDDGINEKRLQYLALVPSSPPANRGVTRAVFNKENIRLRIFYTRANTIVP